MIDVLAVCFCVDFLWFHNLVTFLVVPGRGGLRSLIVELPGDLFIYHVLSIDVK